MFEFKGKSLIQFPNDYVVVDLETTGLDFEYDKIIEISALKIKNGDIIDRFTTLVKPPKTRWLKKDAEGNYIDYEYYIPEFIVDLTGITNEMLDTAPNISDVLPKFKKFIGESPLVGHNIVAFDANFLCQAFKNILEIEFQNNYIDTLRISRWLLKDMKHHRLSDISELLNIDYSNAHRAENDCIITNECFKFLKNEAEKQFGSIDAFLDFLEKRRHHSYKAVSAKDIEVTVDEIDIENPFYEKRCVFTGALEKMTRKEAMQIIKNLGGENEDTITKKTNFLIVGNLDFVKSIKEGKSRKMEKAEKYKEKGQDIEVISENTFYTMIE